MRMQPTRRVGAMRRGMYRGRARRRIRIGPTVRWTRTGPRSPATNGSMSTVSGVDCWQRRADQKQAACPIVVSPTTKTGVNMGKLIGVVVAVASCASLSAQAPQVGGRWLLAGSQASPATPLVVVQHATGLEIENWSADGPVRGERIWAGPVGPKSYTASWIGNTLVVRQLPGSSATPGVRVETWVLESPDSLSVTIESARPMRGRSLERYLYVRASQP